MSQKLGNINITLTNSFYQGNKKEQLKIKDIINENNYYSLINKKRRRSLSHKAHKLNINKCPSCASTLLGKYYNHIHNHNKNKIIENINLKKKENNPEIKMVNNIYDIKEDKFNQETSSKIDNKNQNNKNKGKIKYDENNDIQNNNHNLDYTSHNDDIPFNNSKNSLNHKNKDMINNNSSIRINDKSQRNKKSNRFYDKIDYDKDNETNGSASKPKESVKIVLKVQKLIA